MLMWLTRTTAIYGSGRQNKAWGGADVPFISFVSLSFLALQVCALVGLFENVPQLRSQPAEMRFELAFEPPFLLYVETLLAFADLRLAKKRPRF